MEDNGPTYCLLGEAVQNAMDVPLVNVSTFLRAHKMPCER
jgi:hypothetical protein